MSKTKRDVFVLISLVIGLSTVKELLVFFVVENL